MILLLNLLLGAWVLDSLTSNEKDSYKGKKKSNYNRNRYGRAYHPYNKYRWTSYERNQYLDEP